MATHRSQQDAVHRDVVIVGGGCAGSLAAIHLLRNPRPPRSVTVIERTGKLGYGIAYGTADSRHLLNVPVGRLSAASDDPSHFHSWVKEQGHDVASGAFLPRRLFGEYLAVQLEQAVAAQRGNSEFAVRADQVVRITASAQGYSVICASGAVIGAEHAILAVGTLPAAERAIDNAQDEQVIADPWMVDPSTWGARNGLTVIVGSGLTAIDVALTVCADNPDARVVMVSRTGVFPQQHLAEPFRAPVQGPVWEQLPSTVEELVASVREHVTQVMQQGGDWRDGVDSIRPYVPRLWQALGPAEQQRYLRSEHMRTWEVHRHRMAPSIARTLQQLQDDGRIMLRKGSVKRCISRGEGIVVQLADQSAAVDAELVAGRVVYCTGFGAGVTHTSDVLISSMLADGIAVPDTNELGLHASADGRIIGAGGTVHDGLHVVGALRRGELWESTAVTEIRQQAEAMASLICHQLMRDAAAPTHLPQPLQPLV